MFVSHRPAHALACLIRRRDQDCSSQHEVRNDVQGPPRVFRGQFKCAESSEGVQGPTMVRRSQGEQGPATMCGVLNQWPRNWPSNLLTVPVYRLIKKQTINNKQQTTNNKQK